MPHTIFYPIVLIKSLTAFLKPPVVKFPMIEEEGTVISVEGLHAKVTVPKKSS